MTGNRTLQTTITPVTTTQEVGTVMRRPIG